MKTYFIVDIGGSYTKINIFKNNKLVKKEHHKTIKNKKLLDFIEKKVIENLKESKIKKFDRIGISAPGPLSEKNLTISPTNLQKIKNLSFKKLQKYSKKIILEKDSRCAALSAWIKEGKKDNNLVVFTLGTGLGCGLILNKQIYKGKGTASEFGHSTIDIKGKKSNCNNFGCLEEFVSSRGLLSLARKNKIKGDCFEIEKKAKKGDKKALKTYKEFANYLSVAIVNISNTLDPDKVILTGGLSKASEFYLNEVIKKSKKRFFKGVNPKIKVIHENLSLTGILELVRN